ncbi:helix-turn-helix domain-containing protein [Luteolibacter ambystomatis]|uniref:Helix-turn-helix domain-containing protein n=1 Tax=Luteolibacter ambystomatis TaxID=2824561 RepID=A0A975J1X7_9BACT|nr:helix-turn-helix domain-containing protein [Luteolibacter ambystomatis]QUE52499.1 helix-turn-helix domain-containing protein [Luteolibacter ambystomatis]
MLLQRLRESEIFRVYQEAFRNATGLPLQFSGTDLEDRCVEIGTPGTAELCEALNLCKNSCFACIETNRRLLEEAEVNGPTSCHCFAGLVSSAIPVRFQDCILGYLKTGQVFSQQPTEQDFGGLLEKIGRNGLDTGTIELLRSTFFQTRAVEPVRYSSMIFLLQSFALQLGQQADLLAVQGQSEEPSSVAKAREFIETRLHEPITLSSVARVAGFSESHFCRIFREVTGLTMTDYISRRRIERAKKELLKVDSRVSSVAFDVGFQSISQFNRTFTRITGTSPTKWRAAKAQD